MERPMDLEKFESVKCLYGGVASWACWSPQSDPERKKSGIGDLSIFDPKNPNNTISSLHTNFVLVGLNISRDDVSDKPWRNFHSYNPRANDYKIRLMLEGTKLWGSYMTDIFKNFPEPNSSKVKAYCRKNPDQLESQVEAFREEMKFVCDNQTTLIAFGGVTFEILEANFKNDFKIQKVLHYAYRFASIDEKRQGCLGI